MIVWVTRARPAAEATAARLRATGFVPAVSPLLEVRALPAEIDLIGIDALAFTSGNAVSAYAALTSDRERPVFAVGASTAHAATQAGFDQVRSADGDLPALAALIAREGRDLSILHPAAARPAGDLATLVGKAARIRAVSVYETIETWAPAPEPWDAVLIYSPRAGRALAVASPDVRGRVACAISAAAAEPLAKLSFAEVRIAVAPTEDALLAALGKPGPGV